MAVLKYRNSSNGQLQLLNIPIVQVATIPEAKEDYNNKIVQFVGETTDEFINGYFYKCDGTSWDRINVQPSSGGGGGGTSDYNELENRPKIAGVTLAGDKSLEDLGAAKKTHTHVMDDITDLEVGSTVEVSANGPATETEIIKYITIDNKTWEIGSQSGTTTKIYEIKTKSTGNTSASLDIIYDETVYNYIYTSVQNIPAEIDNTLQLDYGKTSAGKWTIKALAAVTIDGIKKNINEIIKQWNYTDSVDLFITKEITIKDIIPNPEDLSEEAIELTGIRIYDNDYKISGGGSTDQVQSDWTETDTTAKSYVKNKPTDLVHVDSNSNLKNDNGDTISPKTTVENIKDAEGNSLESLLASAGMSAEVEGTRLVLGSGGGAGGGSHTYSTDEQVVGTWIDGKPIYEKVINNINITASMSQTVIDATINTSVVSSIINIIGYYKLSQYDQWRRMETTDIDQNTKNTMLFINSSGLSYSTSSKTYPGTGYVIIQYTKTAD